MLTRRATWGVPLLLTLAGAYAVWRSLGSVSAITGARLHWGDLLGVALIYPVFAAGRGVRFRMLLADPAHRQSWSEAIGVGWMYSAATSLLPGGLGEVSLPMLYRDRRDGGAAATAALLISRVQDLLSWLPLLAAASVTPAGLTPAARALTLFSVLATAAATAFVFLPGVRHRTIALARGLPSPRLGAFLRTFEAHVGGMAGNAGAWAITLGLRVLSVATYCFALRAFGASGSIAEAAVGGGLVALLLVFPIQGIAGLGTAEVWWIMALRLFGEPLSVAAVAAVGVHLSLLVVSLLVGGLSFKTMRFQLALRGETA